MKFQNLTAFDKHLQEAGQDLSRVILIVSPFEMERKKVIQNICTFLPFQSQVFEAGLIPTEQLLEHLNTKNLFGSFSLIIFDGIERLKKSAIEMLADYSSHPSSFAYLILGASSIKNFPELYQKGKKEMLVLDLSEEKPWDRERRLQGWLQNSAKKKNKKLTTEAIAYLIEKVGLDFAYLEQELFKLICYVGDRASLELKDAQAICSPRITATGWQLAENLVWKGEKVPREQLQDMSFFLSFIGQVRYHLQLGAQISSRLEEKETDWEKAFPNLKPQNLQRYLSICQTKGFYYFQKGILDLFDLELASKSSGVEPVHLFENFMDKR